jgi:hypothetical protein
MEKLQNRSSTLEQNLKEREKIVIFLQSELKTVRAENARLNRLNEEFEEKFYLKD